MPRGVTVVVYSDRYRRSRARVVSRLYKTRMCHHWVHGHCVLGASCTFAHGVGELRRVSAW